MSVTGILGSNLFELLQGHKGKSQRTPGQSNTPKQVEDEFTQLSQDLQSGNLAQAQQDVSTLSAAFAFGPSPATLGSANSDNVNVASSSSANSSIANPIQQAFSSLEQDLQSGNLGAAQQDFATLQQSLQSGFQQAGIQHDHHHQGGESQQIGAIQQDFSSLAQALQSGSLSKAQTAYASLQQDSQLLSASVDFNSPSAFGADPSSSTGLNVTA